MGYIDDNIMDGEQVIYRTKLHWMTVVTPIIFALIILVITLILLISGGSAAAVGYFFLIMLLAVVIWVVSAFITFKTSEFGVTNKRILIKVGWIHRVSLETLLTKVEGIQVNQGIIGRIFNYGTIVVTGTGGTGTPFHRIEAPLEFRKNVQEQVDLMQK